MILKIPKTDFLAEIEEKHNWLMLSNARDGKLFMDHMVSRYWDSKLRNALREINEVPERDIMSDAWLAKALPELVASTQVQFPRLNGAKFVFTRNHASSNSHWLGADSGTIRLTFDGDPMMFGVANHAKTHTDECSERCVLADLKVVRSNRKATRFVVSRGIYKSGDEWVWSWKDTDKVNVFGLRRERDDVRAERHEERGTIDQHIDFFERQVVTRASELIPATRTFNENVEAKLMAHIQERRAAIKSSDAELASVRNRVVGWNPVSAVRR